MRRAFLRANRPSRLLTPRSLDPLRRLRSAILRCAFGVAALGAIVTTPTSSRAESHRVAEGQSLGSIAKRYNVTVDALRRKNDLDTNTIRPGQTLQIPTAAEARALEEKAAKKDAAAKREAAAKKAARAEAPPEAETRDAGAKSVTRDGPFTPDKPSERSQTQKTSEARGVNPCNTPDPGFGTYVGWNRAPSMGQMLVPARGGVTKSGGFDLVIHFHGHEAARKEWVKVNDGTVFVGITLGIGSGAYSQAFQSPQSFKELITSVEKAVALERGIDDAHVRNVGLSAWSAGYGAVEQILRQSYGKQVVDTVILLDGLHTGYDPDGTLNSAQLEPFVEFAKRAKAGKRFMYVSHSSIIPPGYASTTETVRQLIHDMGGRPKSQKPRKSDPMGLELNGRWDSGNFHARGYDGNDKMDHCAHLGLLRDVSKVYLRERWNTPKGFGPKAEKDSPAKPARPKKSKKIAQAG